MKKFIKVLAALALLALLSGVLVYVSLHYRVDKAIDKARQEIDSMSPLPYLVREGQWRDGLPSSLKTLTRLSPVNDVVSWNGRKVVATDGGLVINDESGAARLLTAAHGLAGTRVLCLAVFRNMLFAGTDRGITVFEGDGFKSFRFEKPKAGRITCFAGGNKGLIIGTRGAGVLYYSSGNFRYHPSFTDHPGLIVTALSRSGDEIAVGTWKQGVIIESPQGRTFVHEKAGLQGPVNALLRTDEGLLAGTPLGLYRLYDNGRLEVRRSGVSVTSLAVFEGAVFATCRNGGIIKLEEGGYSKEFESRKFHKLSVAGEALYAAGRWGILVRKEDGFAGPFPSLLPGKGLLAENRLTDVAAGPDGRLWVGTFESGVSVLDQNLEDSDRLAMPCCPDVNCVRKGRFMYVGTGRGVLVYNGMSLLKRLDKESGIIGNAVFDVLEDGDTLTMATNRGVSFYSEKGARSIYSFHGLANNHVYSLASFQDRVAAGTLGGLSLLGSTRVTDNYRVNNSSLRHNWITALAANDDALYAGTFGGGVAAFTGHNKWQEIPPPFPKANINQNGLLIWDGLLLAGTFANGLYAYDISDNYWRKIEVPLTSPCVTGLSKWEDGKGRPLLAVATSCGLTLLYPEEIMQ